MKALIPAALIFLFLLPGYLYLGFRLASGPATWIAFAIPFLLIWAMPLVVLTRGPSIPRSMKLVLHSSYISMGVVTYLLVFTIVKDLANLILPNDWSVGISIVLSLTAFAWLLGSFIAWRGARIVEVPVPIDSLPEALNDLKIVQISDLHVGPTIRRSYVQDVVTKANSLDADIIALTGDIADGELDELRDEIAPLAGLRAKLGVYYVIGNHEFYWDGKSWTNMFRELGATVLLNAGARTEKNGEEILVGGIVDPAGAQMKQSDEPSPEEALTAAPNAKLKILLSHRPGYAHRAAKLGYHLQLSGHTHGGQFFPWTLVSIFVHEFNLGLKRAGKMWVHVNPGTGSWGPLLRVGTIPEITLLRLTSKSFSAGS